MTAPDPSPPFVLTRHAQERMVQRDINSEWIRLTIAEPQKHWTDVADATLVHVCRRIDAAESSRVLHVIYNATADPPRVVTCFFDRKMRREGLTE